MFSNFELSRHRSKVKLFHCYYHYNQSVDWFNNGLRSHYVYMYMLVYYGHVILMICFTMGFGDTSLGGYGIYVVLHVAYGWTYVEVG